MGGLNGITPIVGKIFCHPFQTILMVRKRPHVINGGGFVVMNSKDQETVFTVDGCGILGAKGRLVVRDGDGASILFIHKKEGIVQLLKAHNRWKGLLIEYEGPSKLIFTLREPKSCLVINDATKICTELKGNNKDWDFEVKGSFIEKSCTINDRRGNIVAQVGVMEMMASRDFYHVVVQPGYDQAFIVGVIAILDNIHGESTRC